MFYAKPSRHISDPAVASWVTVLSSPSRKKGQGLRFWLGAFTPPYKPFNGSLPHSGDLWLLCWPCRATPQACCCSSVPTLSRFALHTPVNSSASLDSIFPPRCYPTLLRGWLYASLRCGNLLFEHPVTARVPLSMSLHSLYSVHKQCPLEEKEEWKTCNQRNQTDIGSIIYRLALGKQNSKSGTWPCHSQ